MSHTLSVDVYCAAGVGDLAATVVLDDGSRHDVVLADGRLDREFPARPVQLLFDSAAPDGAVVAATADPARAPAGDAVAITADELFGRPLDVPAGGRIARQVVWDCACHGELHVPGTDGRFNSYEHIQCAFWIGRARIADDADYLEAPVEISYETPLELPGWRMKFGEVICLAGDFFAHFDRESAARFHDAWPPLRGVAGWLAGEDYRADLLFEADRTAVADLLATIHRDGTGSTSALGEVFKTAADTALRQYPARRYLALASQNHCHFGSPDPARVPNEALALYRGYHQLACERAAAAGDDKARWVLAVATEAFACHFLTDLFASGHMRTPRRALGERFGILRGALRMSKAMHDEDNAVGLWCTTRAPAAGPRVVWRAFGDGRLLAPESRRHLLQVQEAVRRSVWEIHEARAKRDVADGERAEGRIPVPLPPGHAPRPTDVFPDGAAHAAGAAPNHAPLYALLPSGHVGVRDGARESLQYRDLEQRSGGLVPAFA
jgi:hypothetical protein